MGARAFVSPQLFGRVIAICPAALLLFPVTAPAGEPLRTYKYGSGTVRLAFSPSGSTYAVTAEDNTNLIDTKTGKTLTRLPMGGGFEQAVAYSADGAVFASSMIDKDRSGQTAVVVRVCELPTGRERHALWGPESEVNSLAFSPDGKHLAGGQRDGSITVWSVQSGKVQGGFDSQTTDPHVVFAGAGEELVTAGEDGGLRVWDAKEYKLRQTLVKKSASYVCISYSTSKKELYTLDTSGAVDVWRGPQWMKQSTMELPTRGHTGSALNTAVSIAADAGLVAAPDGVGVSVWDIRTAKNALEYTPTRLHEVTRLSLSPDGKLLLSAARHIVSTESEVFLWRVGRQDAGAAKPGARSDK